MDVGMEGRGKSDEDEAKCRDCRDFGVLIYLAHHACMVSSDFENGYEHRRDLGA